MEVTEEYLEKCSKLSRKDFINLPLEIRRKVLEKQATELMKNHPEYYGENEKC